MLQLAVYVLVMFCALLAVATVASAMSGLPMKQHFLDLGMGALIAHSVWLICRDFDR